MLYNSAQIGLLYASMSEGRADKQADMTVSWCPDYEVNSGGN